MKGILIVNAFLTGNRFNVLYEMLKKSFAEKNIELDIVTNKDVLIKINNFSLECDFIIYWDKDILLSRYLEEHGYKLFNSSKAIELCDDKGLTLMALENKGIKIPKTIISPFTFQNIPYNDFSFIDEVIKELGLPLVVKENKSSFGMGVSLVKTKEELIDLLKNKSTARVLFQEYIASSKGKDVRIEVVNGKAIGSVIRTNENDFRSNVLQGGKMSAWDAPKDFIEVSEKVSQILGLDFCGVDIMFGKNNEPILCEVNSNCHFKTFYSVTNINLADHIRDLIINKIKEA